MTNHYTERLTWKYQEVVDEMKDEGFSGGIMEAVEEFEKKAESMDVTARSSEVRDALIIFAVKGEIDISQITGNMKYVETN